jgi:hypothetical protein
MKRTKITLTPNPVKNKLIIGIQTGAHGRLLLANLPDLIRTEQTILTGDPTSSLFRAQLEKALSTYVAHSDQVYSILELLERKGA